MRIANSLSTASPAALAPAGGIEASRLWRRLGLDILTRFIGRQSMVVATSIVVAFSVSSASVVSYVVWRLASPVMPVNVTPISATIAFIVATPIAAYLIAVIHSLAQSRSKLAELTAQLMQARDEAKDASNAKSQFLASTSHELRTPLNAIIGFSEIMKEEVFGPCGVPRYTEYARDIHNSGTHLLHVINEVLDLSKIEAGQDDLDLDEECDLTAAMADCAKIVAVMARKSGVRLDVIPGASIRIRANGRMIRQILLNLLSNAVKFTPGGGSVTLAARPDPASGAIVEVADSGIGMSGDEIEVALLPFGQIDSKLSRRHDGTGLGLPLAKAMVERHGGALRIESVPREGTIVRMHLPPDRVLPAARIAAAG